MRRSNLTGNGWQRRHDVVHEYAQYSASGARASTNSLTAATDGTDTA